MLRLKLSAISPVLAAVIVLMAVMFVVTATPARAERDIVHFADAINVPAGATAHDTVCFFCSVNIDGTVEGDVVSFFGDVRVADHASVGRDLVNFFGEVRLGEGVAIEHDLVVMFGNLETKSTDSFGGSQVVEPGWLFWGPFLLVFGGIAFIVHEFRGYRRRLRYMRGY